jgi:hypothetical protein
MNEELIAPCGINCGICSRHLALKNNIRSKGIKISYCTGCRPRNWVCSFIKRDCSLLLNGKVQFCYECEDFPCAKLSKLDMKYKTTFRMSPIENLRNIKENGVEKFLASESGKWKCPECGGVICCHNGICFNCGLETLKKKKMYRWEE